jgi:TPR repeat protein
MDTDRTARNGNFREIEDAAREERLDKRQLRRLKRAAEQGDARAAYVYGLAILNGIGGTLRPALGVRWIERAALAGLVEAQYELGILCSNGWSVRRDRVSALAWFMIAADTRHFGAIRKCDDLAREMSSAEIARAADVAQVLRATASHPCELRA